MTAPVWVVKVGGRPQSDPALPEALASVWRTTGDRLVVVHGGGDAVSALQRARGVEPRFVGGRRVTTAEDLDVLRMALSGLANKQLVAAMQTAGVPAFGCSGEDGRLLIATRTPDSEMGAVGVPDRVDTGLLSALFAGGYCPVISPVSADAHTLGEALNVNGDDAAAAVAGALAAAGARAALFFLADVPGVLVDGVPVARLTPECARALIADGTAAGGMAAKLEAALGALAAGVAQVRIGDLAALVDASRGTTVACA